MLFNTWTARNWAVYHAVIPTNLAAGYDLLAGNHAGATGEFEPFDRNRALVEEYGRVEGNAVALREALAFILDSPAEFLKQTANRVSIYFSVMRPTGFWFHLDGPARAVTLALSALYSVLLFFFGFWGVYRMKFLDAPDKRRARWLLAFLAMMPLSIVGIIVETRYRALSYPFFAVFAGFGMMGLTERTEWKAAAVIGGALAANSIADGLINLDRIIGRLRDLFL